MLMCWWCHTHFVDLSGSLDLVVRLLINGEYQSFVNVGLLLKDPTSFSIAHFIAVWLGYSTKVILLALCWKLFILALPIYQPHRGLCLNRRCLFLMRESLKSSFLISYSFIRVVWLWLFLFKMLWFHNGAIPYAGICPPPDYQRGWSLYKATLPVLVFHVMAHYIWRKLRSI